MKNYLLNFASANSTLVTGLTPTMVLFARLDTGATLVGPTITEAVAGWGLYTFQWGPTTPIVFECDGLTTGLGSFRYIKGAIDPSDRADEYGTTIVAIGNSNIALGNSNIALGTTNVALGISNFALGTTNIAFGTSNFAFGSSNFALGVSNFALGTSNFALGTSIYALEQNLGSTLVAIGNTSIALGTSIYAANASLTVTVAGIGTVGSTFGGLSSDPIDLFGYMKRLQENLEGNNTFTKVSGAFQILSRGSSSVLANKTVSNTTATVTKT